MLSGAGWSGVYRAACVEIATVLVVALAGGFALGRCSKGCAYRVQIVKAEEASGDE